MLPPLGRSDLGVFVRSKCNVVHSSFIRLCMFRPNQPSSGVQVAEVKDSAAHCKAGFFPPTVVASGYLIMWVAHGCFWFCLVCWLWLP
jgi:hypothetical protein